MKPLNLFLILILAGNFLSCHNNRNSDEIRSVELFRGGAWLDEGAQLSIDSTLTCRYYDWTKRQHYTANVDQNLWDTIKARFEKLNFRTAKFQPHTNCEDCHVFKLIVHWNNQERQITRAWTEPFDSLLNTLIWLDSTYRRIKLKKTDSISRFEMKYHPSTIVIFDSVGFPPPLPKPKRHPRHS